MKKRRDFLYRRPTQNPYHSEEKKNRPWIMLIVVIISIGASVLFLFFHQFFRIKRSAITLSGLERIRQEELLDAIESIVENDSYLLVDVDELRDILLRRFSIRHIEIKKTFPHTLSIAVEEKLSTIIYDNGTRYATVGADGRIITIARSIGDEELILSSSTAKQVHVPDSGRLVQTIGPYPIVYDTRQKNLTVGETVLSTTTIDNIIEWYALLGKRTDIVIRHMTIEHERGDATFTTNEGWNILVRINERTREQFATLEAVLGSVDKENLHYIDLRFPGRTYWR